MLDVEKLKFGCNFDETETFNKKLITNVKLFFK